MKKFNGFEKYFIQTALKHAIEESEEEIKELIKSDLACGEIPRKFFTSVIRQRNDNINVTKTI